MTSKVLDCCLLLEDEPIIQMSVTQQLASLGVSRVEAFAEAGDAMGFLRENRPDFALLDHRLARGENSNVVALRLIEMGIPTAMTTGLGELWDAPDALADMPVLGKPLDTATLRRHLDFLARSV